MLQRSKFKCCAKPAQNRAMHDVPREADSLGAALSAEGLLHDLLDDAALQLSWEFDR
jgi:hypothetical protein